MFEKSRLNKLLLTNNTIAGLNNLVSDVVKLACILRIFDLMSVFNSPGTKWI